MSFNIETINKRAKEDPAGFARECEETYSQKVSEAATAIERGTNRVVFLSGPSGSGKTTTANRICTELDRRGIRAFTISMDNYFVTFDPKMAPRTPDGELDRESPDCLDLALLGEHTKMIERGEEILKPYFDFKTQSRDMSKAVPIKVQSGEIVIFEGIHALNDILTESDPHAVKIYISTQSGIEKGGEVLVEKAWLRLMRRVVRDEAFRGTDVSKTLKMWPSVRAGQKAYIAPFKHKAGIVIDSSLAYEVPVIKHIALKAFERVSDDPTGILAKLVPALHEFEEIEPEFVPKNSILREFIGGGVYKY